MVLIAAPDSLIRLVGKSETKPEPPAGSGSFELEPNFLENSPASCTAQLAVQVAWRLSGKSVA